MMRRTSNCNLMATTQDTRDSSESSSSSGVASVVTAVDESNLKSESKCGRMMKRWCRPCKTKWGLTALIISVGITFGTAFIFIGILGENQKDDSYFLQHAAVITNAIQSAWNDYELLGRWIHESCHKPYKFEDITDVLGHCTHDEFHELYEYIASEDDLDVQAVNFVPNITDAARTAVELEALLYYKNYPTVNYQGILQPTRSDVVLNATFATEKALTRPFYFPLHYVEPIVSNEDLIGLDLYYATTYRGMIETTLKTWKPVLSDRQRLAAAPNSNDNSVAAPYMIFLFHPGTKTSVQTRDRPSALSLLMIRVQDVLKRAVRYEKTNEAVYVFDSTSSEGEPQFMAGIRINTKGVTTAFEMLPETRMRDISHPRHARHTNTHVTIVNRQWTIVIVSSSFATNYIFVVMGGVIIFLACAIFAIWFQYHFYMASKMASTQAIFSSMFPKDVQDRLLEQAIQDVSEPFDSKNDGMKSQIKKFFGHDDLDDVMEIRKTKPIADLFPEVTILFANIVGFTAWSSTREPTQVFTLLETVYQSFDLLAKRRHVFKVETVGDCYVAATGLSEPKKDHAVLMARFAHDCISRFAILSRRLEIELGPDTADLGLRVGMHSGPVISGVLRGEKPRFQLFGDTMCVTAHMETSGQKNKIHVSKDTADLLDKAGRGNWLVPREDKVMAKGKGKLETFWLEPVRDASKSYNASTLAGDDEHWKKEPVELLESKRKRLVKWNTETLVRLLKAVVAHRKAANEPRASNEVLTELEQMSSRPGITLLDETVNVIELPAFDAQAAQNAMNPDDIKLDFCVEAQLFEYIDVISQLYQENPFHNFEHASHVTMSSVKLLSRIVAPDLDQKSAHAKGLHDFTYGITSDPLTQFALVLSALVHDVDHPGVPNTQLVKEGSKVAVGYKNKSVAEQNSVDVAWKLLMKDAYQDLRRTIYVNENEYFRFRQLIVNIVLATDVMDKELGDARKARWNTAFSPCEAAVPESTQTAVNRKATIVMEHLIQASDVAHTMQHWHVYRKWNARLFEEMYGAYLEGRAEKNPADFWYEGEKGFLDFYIIPLAKKLKTCGVFGVSSDEYLNYAEKNRQEWEIKGQEIVAEMVEMLREPEL